jgi:hypothetical protein
MMTLNFPPLIFPACDITQGLQYASTVRSVAMTEKKAFVFDHVDCVNVSTDTSKPFYSL